MCQRKDPTHRRHLGCVNMAVGVLEIMRTMYIWLPAPAARSSSFFCTPFSCCEHHQRNGSSDCACMTVPSPNYLDSSNVSSRASRMRIEPQDPIQSLLLPGISPVLWKPHIVAVSLQQVLERSAGFFGCSSDRLSELLWYPRVTYYWVRPYAVMDGLMPS